MSESAGLWLLYQVPEAFLMMFCGTRLLGLRPAPRRFWSAVALLAVAVPLARRLLGATGLHTLVLFVLYVILATNLFRVSFATGLSAATVAFFLLTMGEYMVMIPATALFGLDAERLFLSGLWGQLTLGYLGSTLLITGALAAYFGGFILVKAPEAQGKECGLEAA